MARSDFDRRYGWWLRRKWRMRALLSFWAIVPLSMIGIGVGGIDQTLIALPRQYDALEQRGRLTTASFAGCTGGRDSKCRLTLPGSSRSWDYSENFPQFEGLPIGAPVPVLVDPDHPGTRYTVLDVTRRTNAGFGVVAAFSSVVGLTGLVGLPWFARWARRFLRGMRP
jgi:hypothetical protein